MKSPTELSLRACREKHWFAAVVESWVPGAAVRRDLFGFGDILVIDGLPGSRIVQATSSSNAAARVKKIIEKRRTSATAWLQNGNRIEVWAWKGQRLAVTEIVLRDGELVAL